MLLARVVDTCCWHIPTNFKYPLAMNTKQYVTVYKQPAYISVYMSIYLTVPSHVMKLLKTFRIIDFKIIFQTQQLIFCFPRHISQEHNYASSWLRPGRLDPCRLS